MVASAAYILTSECAIVCPLHNADENTIALITWMERAQVYEFVQNYVIIAAAIIGLNCVVSNYICVLVFYSHLSDDRPVHFRISLRRMLLHVDRANALLWSQSATHHSALSFAAKKRKTNYRSIFEPWMCLSLINIDIRVRVENI